jgi:hypothetical protein
VLIGNGGAQGAILDGLELKDRSKNEVSEEQ